MGLGPQGSEAVNPGSSPCRAKHFYDFADFCQKFHSNGSHGTVGRQHGSEAVGPGSSFCRAKYFNDFIDICQKFQWLPWRSW